MSLCPFYVSRSFFTCLPFSLSLSLSLSSSRSFAAFFQRFPRKKLRGSVRLRRKRQRQETNVFRFNESLLTRPILISSFVVVSSVAFLSFIDDAML